MTQDEQIVRARQVAGIIAVLALGAVVSQSLINMTAASARGESPVLAVVLLYGYFTIWSNTLVGLVAGRFALRGEGDGVLTRPGTLAAALVYIVVVGLIYNVLLAKLNNVSGVRLAVDTVLHSVVPTAYALWWLLLVPRRRIGWNALAPAMAFPFAYCIVAMGRGALTGKYAYFFIDAGKLGMPQVALNIAGLVLFFGGLMAAVIAFDRWAHRREPTASTG